MSKEVSFGARSVRSARMNVKRKDFLTNPSGSLAKGSNDADRCKFLYDKALRFARHKVILPCNTAKILLAKLLQLGPEVEGRWTIRALMNE